jgi:hypothetical protein
LFQSYTALLFKAIPTYTTTQNKQGQTGKKYLAYLLDVIHTQNIQKAGAGIRNILGGVES